jgi:hypothetical protein
MKIKIVRGLNLKINKTSPHYYHYIETVLAEDFLVIAVGIVPVPASYGNPPIFSSQQR